MKKMLNEIVFKDRLPNNFRLAWPVNPDDTYLIVFVQWDQGEPWEAIPVEVQLSACNEG